MKYVIFEKAYRKPRTTVPLKSGSRRTKPTIPKVKKRSGKASGTGVGVGQSF